MSKTKKPQGGEVAWLYLVCGGQLFIHLLWRCLFEMDVSAIKACLALALQKTKAHRVYTIIHMMVLVLV